ncbi:MAG TPA: TlpA disulfide reductase family protein [Gammaproteobacteria bacterium]|nr:TlpA disulfide reductase family protein [Gammaproteobacteria bacterium]
MRKEYTATAFLMLLVAAIAWVWLSPGGLDTAPDITFRTIDNRTIDLQSLRGQPVLVTFWATTCSGCMQEMPHLISLYNDYEDKGLEIIGVAMPYDIPSHVVQLASERNVPYPIALDIDSSITSAFGDVMLTPTSFLIAPDGTIIKHKIGEMDMKKLREQISNLLSRQSKVTNNKSKEANRNI